MKGSCLCGEVTFEVDPPFKVFQYCHCTRCRKFTGSAHASNLFVHPDQLHWTKGATLVGRFEMPDSKYFATCFCKNCGSSLPWQAKGVPNLVIPAGTLDEDPGIKPQHSIYWDSRACWYTETHDLPKYAELPPRKDKKA